MATFINPSATDRHTNFPNRETNVGVHTLTLPDATATSNSTLPAVDWLRVGKTPPSRIHVDERKPEDRLPLTKWGDSPRVFSSTIGGGRESIGRIASHWHGCS
jgi:hypothetical protein